MTSDLRIPNEVPPNNVRGVDLVAVVAGITAGFAGIIVYPLMAADPHPMVLGGALVGGSMIASGITLNWHRISMLPRKDLRGD